MRTQADKTPVQVTTGRETPPASGGEAIRRCDHALSDLFTVRGQLQLLLGNTTQAVADLTHAIDLTPDKAVAHYNRGLAHKAAGNADAARIDREMAHRLDANVSTTLADRSLESGYRIIALYNSGREDHRPLGFYPFSPSGLRRAISHAQSMGRDGSERSSLDNTYQVDDQDFIAMVQEYHLTTRDVLAVPPEGVYQCEPIPDNQRSPADERITRATPTPTPGHWPCWNALFDDRDAPKHDLTEADATTISGHAEAHVRQLVPPNLNALQAAAERLPAPDKVMQTTLECCWRSHKDPTVNRVLRSLDDNDNVQAHDLANFLTALSVTKQRIVSATLDTSRAHLERMPQTVRKAFTRDLGVFVYEELLKTLAAQTIGAATPAEIQE